MPMLHDESQRKTDEDAVANGHCPECGQSLEGKDPRNHLELEFPRWQEPGMENTDYGRRARLLDAFASHKEQQAQKGQSH